MERKNFEGDLDAWKILSMESVDDEYTDKVSALQINGGVLVRSQRYGDDFSSESLCFIKDAKLESNDDDVWKII